MRIDAEQVLWSVPAEQRVGRPLLVLLHGHGMNERIGVELLDQLPPQLVVASLRGPLPVRAGYGWFPLDASFTLAAVSSAVAAVLAWVDAQPGHPSVGLLGFSQGSSIAAQCLRERPGQFAYAALLAGFVSPLPAPGDSRLAQLRPPVFSGRGEADHLVPKALVTTTEYWLRRHTAVTSRTYRGLGHNVSAEEIADLSAFWRACWRTRRAIRRRPRSAAQTLSAGVGRRMVTAMPEYVLDWTTIWTVRPVGSR